MAGLTTLSIGGAPYRCRCGCNVFQKLGPVQGTDRILYRCNACHDDIQGEPSGPETLTLTLPNTKTERIIAARQIAAQNCTLWTPEQYSEVLEALDEAQRRVAATEVPTAKVTLFKPSGKYYTMEEWRVPEGAIGPHNMIDSPDFRRIDGGAVLVEDQEPWGYPILFPGVPEAARV